MTMEPTVLGMSVETIIVFVIVAVGLDMIVGKEVLLGDTCCTAYFLRGTQSSCSYLTLLRVQPWPRRASY
jgi:hypothetical protein